MQQIAVTALPPRGTRRWPRYQIDLPVRIIGVNGIRTTPFTGRGSDISRAGMALHADVALDPGDMMMLQFPTAEPSKVNAIVRHRNGTLLGLEFLSQLPPDDETKLQMKTLPTPSVPVAPTTKAIVTTSETPKAVFTSLRRKQEEHRQLRKEIEVLSLAILLLAENDRESTGLAIPRQLAPASKPWPLQA